MTQDFLKNQKKWKLFEPSLNSKNYYFIELFSNIIRDDANKEYIDTEPDNLFVYHEEYPGKFLIKDLRNGFRFKDGNTWSEAISFTDIVKKANEGGNFEITNDYWEFEILSREDFLKLNCEQSYSRSKIMINKFCTKDSPYSYYQKKYLKYKKKYIDLKYGNI